MYVRVILGTTTISFPSTASIAVEAPPCLFGIAYVNLWLTGLKILQHYCMVNKFTLLFFIFVVNCPSASADDPCSGHGVCTSLWQAKPETLGLFTPSLDQYTNWDANASHVCVCDRGKNERQQ